MHDASLLLVCEAADARVLNAGRHRGGILVVDVQVRLLHVGASFSVMAVGDIWGSSLTGASVLVAGEYSHGWQVAESPLSGSSEM